MAGAEGLEPSTKVLETHVLPLHHAPTRNKSDYTPRKWICQGKNSDSYPDFRSGRFTAALTRDPGKTQASGQNRNSFPPLSQFESSRRRPFPPAL